MRKIIEPEINTDREHELHELERAYAKGTEAMKQRNELLIELIADGYSVADLHRRLNKARTTVGAPLVTHHAVAMVLRRDKKKKGNSNV